MKCPRCGYENPPTLKFCGECGARLAVVCAACGASNAPAQKFCGECGAQLVHGALAARFTSPDSYTPKHLAERILNSRAAIEGERKQVTVLFADMKGSMELLAERDPEEARKILDPVLERVMEAVHRYEGTVNQVTKEYASGVQWTAGVPIQIRVGLNSGEVVVRSVGSDLRMDYTAVGQTAHLAARMEQMAMGGSVLITSDTLRLAEDFVEIRSLGPVIVKGLAHPVEVYEATGAGVARRRFEATVIRGLTRFVGRAPEIEQLARSLGLAAKGQGQVVALVGEPGVGKSRLFYEFLHSNRTTGWLVLESGSVSYGKATPYLPLTDLLKAYFQIELRDDARKVREKVTGKLIALDRTLEPVLPAFLALFDVSVEDAQWQALDPPQRRSRTLDACRRLLLRECQIQPLLLVFEDLHWIDTETQGFLDNLIESLASARLLLLVNYRPEYQHQWGSKTYYTQLRIDPLGPESAEELLDMLLGDDPGLRPAKRLLIERTEGNPLFLEESVRNLVETHALRGERGAYRLARDVTSLEVAPTLQSVLGARVDRLPPEEKRLLETAAVIGKDVPFALLQAVCDQNEVPLRHGLAHLQATEFLYEATLFPDLEYTFKHALTHDVAYGSLLQERKRVLHARIVEAIEKLYLDRLAELVEQLAHHAFRGEVWEKAVTYLRQAGAKAFQRSANREAVGCFEQALVALQHLPETRETLEQAVDLRFDLRPSLFALNELPRLIGHLHEAEGLAHTLGDQRRLGWVSVYKSHYLWSTGHSSEARTFAENALAIAEALGDLPLQVGANQYLGSVCLTSGNYARAETFLRKVLRLLGGERSRDRYGLTGFPAAMARGHLAWALAERGSFEDGIAQGQEGIRLAEEFDHPFSWIVASWGPAHLYRLRGKITRAVRLLERAQALSRDWKIVRLAGTTSGFLGYVYVISGRVAEGLSLLNEAQESDEQWQTLIVAHMGEACLLADRLDDAVAFADRALTFARERGQRGYEAHTLRILGEIASHLDSPDAEAAESYYRDALALAHELEMLPLVAHCQLALGRLYRRAGDESVAREHLTAAVTLYREMQMPFWVQKAEVESKPV